MIQNHMQIKLCNRILFNVRCLVHIIAKGLSYCAIVQSIERIFAEIRLRVETLPAIFNVKQVSRWFNMIVFQHLEQLWKLLYLFSRNLVSFVML